MGEVTRDDATPPEASADDAATPADDHDETSAAATDASADDQADTAIDRTPPEEQIEAPPGPAVHAVRRINRVLHYAAGVVLTALMLLTVVDILSRWLFNSPFAGTVELTELAMIAIVYLGFAYAEHEREHISVDILYARLGPGGQRALDLFAGTLHTIVLLLLTWRLAVHALGLAESGFETGVLRVPIWPFGWLAVVGVIAFVAATLARVLRLGRAARGEASAEPGSAAAREE